MIGELGITYLQKVALNKDLMVKIELCGMWCVCRVYVVCVVCVVCVGCVYAVCHVIVFHLLPSQLTVISSFSRSLGAATGNPAKMCGLTKSSNEMTQNHLRAS